MDHAQAAQQDLLAVGVAGQVEWLGEAPRVAGRPGDQPIGPLASLPDVEPTLLVGAGVEERDPLARSGRLEPLADLLPWIGTAIAGRRRLGVLHHHQVHPRVRDRLAARLVQDLAGQEQATLKVEREVGRDPTSVQLDPLAAEPLVHGRAEVDDVDSLLQAIECELAGGMRLRLAGIPGPVLPELVAVVAAVVATVVATLAAPRVGGNTFFPQLHRCLAQLGLHLPALPAAHSLAQPGPELLAQDVVLRAHAFHRGVGEAADPPHPGGVGRHRLVGDGVEDDAAHPQTVEEGDVDVRGALHLDGVVAMLQVALGLHLQGIGARRKVIEREPTLLVGSTALWLAGP